MFPLVCCFLFACEVSSRCSRTSKSHLLCLVNVLVLYLRVFLVAALSLS